MVFSKRVPPLVLFLLVSLGAVPALAQVNLLQNPGFESGSSHPDGWLTFPASPPPGVTFSWDPAVSHGGSRSVSIESTRAGLFMWRQVLSVTENSVFTFSGYCNVENVAPQDNCRLELLFRDQLNGVIIREEILRHNGTIEWIHDLPHDLCFRAPSGAVSVEVNLVLQGTGKVWFDDILFGLSPLGSVAGTVSNGAAPVEGARVEVWGTDLEAFADRDGHYRIDGIPDASPRYVLIASAAGYRGLPAGNVDVADGRVTDVDFVLRPGDDPFDTDIRVKCGRLIWRGQAPAVQVDTAAVIDPLLYPPEVIPFLAPHEYIDSDHALVVQTAAAILDSVDPADRDNTLAVSHAVYSWIVKNVEWDGVFDTANFSDVTSGKFQTITGVGWCFANSFAEWLYKPSEMLAESRGICIEHGRLDAALLRALGIPARPMQPYGGAQFWVQPPSGPGAWAILNTSGGRSAYKKNGDLWSGYAATPESSVYGFPVDGGGWIHSDWNTLDRCLWREDHPWSERYEDSQTGFDQAVVDLALFEQTGQAPQSTFPGNGPCYEINYSDFTLDLRGIGDQRVVVARFPLPVESPVVQDMDEIAYWTDHGECVTGTWIETVSNPPVVEVNRWFNIAFDLSSLLPPVLPELCDLKANGSDGPLTVYQGNRVQVTLSLDPGSLVHLPADWWVTAETPLGWYSFRPLTGWQPGITRVWAGGLFPVPASAILDTDKLPTGEYTFHFALDGVDGLPQGTLHDSVEVVVE
jgi:hypothetical protein